MNKPKWSEEIAMQHILEVRSPFENQLMSGNGQGTTKEQLIQRFKATMMKGKGK